MSYLQHGVPMSTDDMQRILDLIDHAEDTGFEDCAFLERMKVLFCCSFNEAEARDTAFLARYNPPSDDSSFPEDKSSQELPPGCL